MRNSKRFGIALETVLELLEDGWEEEDVYIYCECEEGCNIFKKREPKVGSERDMTGINVE